MTKKNTLVKIGNWFAKNNQKPIEKNAQSGFRQKIQKIGSFMAGMILPSIGVFIAWGLWTSMFINNSSGTAGWFAGRSWSPAEINILGGIVGPGIKYLLPILIGINAGRMIYGVRGGAFAAFMVLIIIIGTDNIWNLYPDIIQINGKSLAGRAPNQIIGAMLIAPLSVWIFKKIESSYIEKISPGFEMLIKNFSLALIAIVLGLAIFYLWAWVMFGITWVLTSIISIFGTNKYVAPLMTIFTEPTRTIFLNNALNHGVLSPIGLNQVEAIQSSGAGDVAKSIFFLYGGNAGPGFGLLIAYAIFRKGSERTNALGSSVIQLFGGIHEVYYVYVIAKPIMILATIPGAAVSMTIFSYLGGGTATTISPGSIISVISTSPNGYSLGINLLGIFAGALTTFFIASLILITQRKKHQGIKNLTKVHFTDEGMNFIETQHENIQGIDYPNAKKLIVACDAGVGSSAMAAGIIRKWVKEHNIDISVSNCALKDLPPDADIIVTTDVFEKFAQIKSQKNNVYTVKQFLNKNEYNLLYENLERYKKKIEE